MSNKTLVLGIGNSIMQDDGIGVRVIQRLQDECSNFSLVEFLDGGTLGFNLIGQIESANHLIVIDAARFDAEPGAVKVFYDEEMDKLLGRQKNASVHDVTLVDLMSIALLSDEFPTKRALIGVQPECVDLGTEPTPAVKNAIPVACEAVKELLSQWQN